LALHSLPTRAFAGTSVLCLGEKIEVIDKRTNARVLVDHFNLFPPTRAAGASRGVREWAGGDF
jgi:hypothetical protein